MHLRNPNPSLIKRTEQDSRENPVLPFPVPCCRTIEGAISTLARLRCDAFTDRREGSSQRLEAVSQTQHFVALEVCHDAAKPRPLPR